MKTKLPPLNALRMFEAAGRHLNFRLAAEELHLTQGAVAQQVRQLEAALQMQLFHRLPRGLAFTEAGERYARQISAALALIAEATENLHPLKQSLTISVTPSFATKWLIPRLSSFTEQWPDIDVRLDASEKLASFGRDGVDLAVRQAEPPFADGLIAQRIFSIELSAYASPTIAETGPSSGNVNDWNDWIYDQSLIYDGHRHWKDYWSDNPQLSLHPGPLLKVNQTAMAIDAAAAGQGVILAPKWSVEQDLAANRLARLFDANLAVKGGLYLVYPEATNGAKDPNSVVMKFVSWVSQQAGAVETD